MRVDQHSSCGSTTCVWMNATCVWINPGRGERDKKGVRVEKYICLECNNECVGHHEDKYFDACRSRMMDGG